MTGSTSAARRVEVAADIVFVCGPCAARVVAAGGERAKVDEIDLNTECAVHENGRGPQATSGVRLPADWERTRPTLPPSPPPALDVASLPTTAGPLTSTALALLCAWTRDQGFADDFTIKAAVGVAEKLLRVTKGA